MGLNIAELTDRDLCFTRIAQINVEVDRLMVERANIIKTVVDDFKYPDYATFNLEYLNWQKENQL